jgi:hypothetical protein
MGRQGVVVVGVVVVKKPAAIACQCQSGGAHTDLKSTDLYEKECVWPAL